jgi:NTE family protein
VQLGQTDRFMSEWYQPLTSRQRVFMAPRVEVIDEPFDLYDPNSNKRLARFRRQSSEFGLDVGTPLGASGELRLGLSRGRVHFSDDTSFVSAAQLADRRHTGGLLARLRVDELDSLTFPRSGYAGDVRLFFSHASLGADEGYTKAAMSFQAATHWGPHTLRGAVRAGGNLKDGSLPDHELFKLGGFLQLSGYKTGQLLGTDMRFGRVVYNYRLSGPGFFDGMYAGASLEAGRIGGLDFSPTRGTRHQGGSVYFAIDTPIGPLYLAFGVADGGNRAGYLFLGQP